MNGRGHQMAVGEGDVRHGEGGVKDRVHRDGKGGRRCFLASSYREKIEERERWAREEKERTSCKVEEDAKLRERRGRMVMGSPMLGVVGEELAPGGGRR